MHPIEHLRYIARARGVDSASLVRETAIALGSLRADPANLVIACRRIVERHVTVAPMWWLCAELLVAEAPDRLAWELADAIEADPTPDLISEALAGEWPGAARMLTVGYSDVLCAALIERADVNVWCADSGHSASSMLQRLERGGIDSEPVPADAIGNAVAAVDVVLIEALVAAPHRVLASAGTLAVASAAYVVGTPIWLVAPLGTRLPPQYVDAIANVAFGDVTVLDREFDELPTDMVSRVVGPDRTHNARATPADQLAGGTSFAPELLRAAEGRA
ncbi:MAG TPA: hypothetical protein VMM60_16520 [Ilumatobacter sp.]|nr:hypothetical protein [Ilumatobacter sp.]